MPMYRLIATVKAEAHQEAQGSYLVCAPSVGVADGVPRLGTYLNPQDRVLTLRILNRPYLVELPRHVQGVVQECFIEDTQTPVGYNQPLVRLVEAAQLAGNADPAQPRGDTNASDDAHLVCVRAPSEGVFYRRASPESPPYVEEGSEVVSGTTLGLVEVMKSFNQIGYGGPGLPERGRVVRILVDDGAEVAFNQVLFHIEGVGAS